MATFAKAAFNASTYATFRPTYPLLLFTKILTYHCSPSTTLLDLGCGHGLISRELAPSFKRVLATDPSASMVAQARSSTPASQYPNIEVRQASAEDLNFVKDAELDMVVAGQAAHWFDYSKVWPELARTVRKGGTLAFWGYKDNIFVDHPKATAVLDKYCYGASYMGPFWEQPGRNILRDRLHAVVPPESDWEDIQRIEYEPNTEGKGVGKGEGEVLMGKRLKLGEVEGYVRTFSAYWSWVAAHPEEKSRKEGGEGDIVDRMFEEMLGVEEGWGKMGEGWREVEVENEWGSVILMARRRNDYDAVVDWAVPVTANVPRSRATEEAFGGIEDGADVADGLDVLL